MARPSKAEVARRQKDAKQKKLLFVLIPVFLLLVAWQGPKMYKALFGSGPEATPAPATTTPGPAAPGTPAPAETSTTPAAPPSAGLADTDVPPAAGTARLVSFSRFESRDPFGTHAPTGGEADAPAIPEETLDEIAAASLRAVLEVNGASETVAVDSEFPAGDPTFRLVSLSEDEAVIGLVSGSFEGAEETVTLAVGEEIELVADPDGTRYTVTLVSID